ncbi:MAG: hypothetical protein ISR75_00675 [Phycisphaerales bacterium]|nr:hypothetical protein [Planctomycetota bacterium]MBL6996936.1 hypothetical protein [Phycisphaerales bacterium]
MKRTTTICLLFVLLMMLGMSSPSSQSSCNLSCSTTHLMGFLKPTHEQLMDVEKKKPQQNGRVRPDRKNKNMEWRKPFPPNSPIPANMVEHIMAVAKEIDPELATQLMSMCEKDPEAFNTIVRKQGRRLGSLIHLRESDPELYEVKVTELKTDAEIYQIAEAIRGQDQTDPLILAKIAELEGLIRVRTAMSIRAQTLYIERLEQHLVGLRTRLEDTSNRFDEMVGERLEQLLQVVSDEPSEKPSPVD